MPSAIVVAAAAAASHHERWLLPSLFRSLPLPPPRFPAARPSLSLWEQQVERRRAASASTPARTSAARASAAVAAVPTATREEEDEQEEAESSAAGAGAGGRRRQCFYSLSRDAIASSAVAKVLSKRTPRMGSRISAVLASRLRSTRCFHRDEEGRAAEKADSRRRRRVDRGHFRQIDDA